MVSLERGYIPYFVQPIVSQNPQKNKIYVMHKRVRYLFYENALLFHYALVYMVVSSGALYHKAAAAFQQC